MVATLRTPLLALLAIGTLVLAGCAGASQETPASEPPLADPTTSDTTGAIQGRVTDDEALPLQGVEIGLVELSLLAQSNPEGRFVFADVPAGTYTLAAQKLGYESRGIAVHVVIGEVADVELELVQLRAAVPYIQVDEYAGHIDWAFRYETIYSQLGLPCSPGDTYGIPCNLGLASGDLQHFWETEDRTDAIDAMYIEMAWDDTQALAGGMRLRVEVQGEANNLDYTFCILQSTSPALCLVEKATIDEILARGHSDCDEESCEMQWRGFTATMNTNMDEADAGVMLDQDFTVWVSHFYRQAYPEGYSARPDA